MNQQYEFDDKIEDNNIENVKLLLKDKMIDPAIRYNSAIRYASYNGFFEIVKLLLNDNRVNPADVNNSSICCAFKKGHTKIVDLLWKDLRVRNTLNKNDSELYNDLLTKELVNNINKF
jgi:hypothetical protein